MEGLSATIAALLALFAPQAPAPAWMPVWERAAELARTERGTPRFAALVRELDSLANERETIAKAQHDRPTILRARLLRADVAMLAGRPARPFVDPQTSFDFLPGEARLAVRYLGPCALRVEALALQLHGSTGAARRELVDRGEGFVEEEAAAGRIDLAIATARALEREARDPRTGRILARALRLAGEPELADARIEAALAERPDPEERLRLYEERAWARAERGPLAVRSLGAALAAGSSVARWLAADAALAQGQRARAQVVFRSLVNDDAYRERAWRGLGTLVLSAPAESADAPASAAREPRNP